MLGFVLELLHAVLAEEALACVVGLEDDLDRMNFADGPQRDIVHGAVRPAAGFSDLLVQVCEVFGDGHALCILSS